MLRAIGNTIGLGLAMLLIGAARILGRFRFLGKILLWLMLAGGYAFLFVYFALKSFAASVKKLAGGDERRAGIQQA